MYALVDCNNFYASCERVFRPFLNGKPIVVLSNNDGCVIARSNEAKELGIPMGAPAFGHRKTFEQKGVHVFSSNYALYADMSNRVTSILRQCCPDVEIYSIDESFLHFGGFDNYALNEYCLGIKNKIHQYTMLPVCIGIAPTKALAKVANHIAKKFPHHHQGVYMMDTEEKRIKALKWLDIGDVWGIGRRIAKKLMAKGVLKAHDFTLLPDEYVRKEFSVVGLRLKKELLGISVLELEDLADKKSIATTRSFEQLTEDFDYVQERVVTFASSCAEKLRAQHSHCSTLAVFLQTSPFRAELSQYSRSMQVELPYASNSGITLAKIAAGVLRTIYKEGYLYKKAGVVVSGLTPESTRQYDMFEDENPKHQPLMKIMDKLNAKHHDKVRLCRQSYGKKWKMKQEKLSPSYTTKWNDILKIQ